MLERRERVGGACTLERPFSDERYVVSPCAYVVGVLDDLVISELGLRERGVEITVADPALFIPFDDGTAFVEFDDEEKTLAALRELGISDKDIKGFHAYGETFDRARRKLRKGERDAWVGESPSRAELEEMLGEPDLIDLVFEASISDVLDAHVDDQRIKDALYGQGLIAAYGGPKDKGTAMIHLMHHMGELGPDRPGAWGYVKGGMGMVSFAICDAAIEAGAEVACGVPVCGGSARRGRRARGRNAHPREHRDLERRPEAPARDARGGRLERRGARRVPRPARRVEGPKPRRQGERRAHRASPLDRGRRRDLAGGRNRQLPRQPGRRAGGLRGVGPRRAFDRLHRDLLADGRRPNRRAARPPRHLRRSASTRRRRRRSRTGTPAFARTRPIRSSG